MLSQGRVNIACFAVLLTRCMSSPSHNIRHRVIPLPKTYLWSFEWSSQVRAVWHTNPCSCVSSAPFVLVTGSDVARELIEGSGTATIHATCHLWVSVLPLHPKALFPSKTLRTLWIINIQGMLVHDGKLQCGDWEHWFYMATWVLFSSLSFVSCIALGEVTWRGCD